MIRPDLNNVPPFYRGYIELVKDYDMYEILEKSNVIILNAISSIGEEMGQFRYAPDKWTIKELLCHLIDAERIFAYRALRFSRNDKTPLSGFEEKDYAIEANAHSRSVASIANEIKRLRATTLDLYKSFSDEMLKRIGTANNSSLSVLNLGFIISGHETHHLNVLRERYLRR